MVRETLVFFYILLLPYKIIAQHNILSLSNDSTNVVLLQQSSIDSFLAARYEVSIQLAHKQAKIAKKNAFRYLEISAYRQIGRSYLYVTNTDSVLFYLNQVLDLTNNSTDKAEIELRSKALSNLGILNQELLGQIETAFDYYLQSQQEAEKIDNIQQILESTWRICNIYYSQDRYSEVLDIAQKTLDKYKHYSTVNEGQLLDIERWIAVINGKTSTSPETRKESLNILKRNLAFYEKEGNHLDKAFVIIDIIEFFHQELSSKEFIKYANEANDLSNQLDFGGSEVMIKISYGKALARINQHKKAIEIFKTGIKLIQNQLDHEALSELHFLIANSYEELGRPTNALLHYKKYTSYNDSLSKKIYDRQILQLQAQYDSDKKEADNQLLTEQNKLIQTRNYFYLIIGGILFLLLLATFYVLYHLKQNEERLKKTNLANNQLFTILAHDLQGPANSFKNLTDKIAYLLRNRQPERLLKMADYFEEAGHQVYQDLKTLLQWAIAQKDNFNTQPEKILTQPCVKRVIQELAYSSERKNITIHNQIPIEHEAFIDKSALEVIIRNLLHNAIKFSYPNDHIEIKGQIIAKKSVISIKDNGIGTEIDLFEKLSRGEMLQNQLGTNEERGNALGLTTCYTIAAKNNAQLQMQSTKGKGVTMELIMLRS